jgi:hypothetical protein
MKNIFKSILLFSFLFSFANVSFGASIPLVTNTSFDSSKIITTDGGTGYPSVNFSVNQNGGSVTETGVIWSLEYGFPRIENIDPAKPQTSGRVSHPIGTINNPWEGEFSSASNTINFVHTLDLTSPDNTYNIRPYAINENGVGYGPVITYKTGLPDLVIHVGEDVVSGQKPITETSLLGWIDPFGYIHDLGNYRTTTSPIHILGEIATRNKGTGDKHYQSPVVTDIKDFLIPYKTFVNNPTPSGYFSSLNSSGIRIQNLGIHFSEPRGTVQSYRLCADKEINNFNSSGVVIESDENNNCTVWKDILVKRCPVINLNTASSGGEPGFTTTINWSVSNPPAIPGYDDKDPTCVASGNWSGGKTLSGTENIGPLNESKKYTYTLSCANVDGPCSDTETITICEEGKIWNPKNNKCEVSTKPSGTLSVASPACKIKEGNSSCNASLTWTTTNLIQGAKTAVTRDNPENTKVSTATSGKDFLHNVSPGKYNFYLYHNEAILSGPVSFSAECDDLLKWDGGKCILDNSQGPDLIIVKNSTTPNTAKVNENTKFSATVKNDGTKTTNLSFINLFQSSTDVSDKNNPIDLKDYPTSSMNALLAGDEDIASVNIKFGEAQDYYIRACADKSSRNDVVGKIAESDEDHNCGDWTLVKVSTTPIIPPEGELTVDLLVNGSDNPPAVKFNSVVNLSWTSTGPHKDCKLTGGEFNTIVAKSDNKPSSPLKNTVTYTLVCGNGPKNTDRVEVKVLPPNVNFDEI